MLELKNEFSEIWTMASLSRNMEGRRNHEWSAPRTLPLQPKPTSYQIIYNYVKLYLIYGHFSEQFEIQGPLNFVDAKV